MWFAEIKHSFKVTIYRMEGDKMILSIAYPPKNFKTEGGANRYADKALKQLNA